MFKKGGAYGKIWLKKCVFQIFFGEALEGFHSNLAQINEIGYILCYFYKNITLYIKNV